MVIVIQIFELFHIISLTSVDIWKGATHFQSNLTTIAENVRFEGGFVSCLEKHKVITKDKAEKVNAMATRHEKAELLLHFVQRGLDESRLNGFIAALEETDQSHLAILVKTGGGFEYTLSLMFAW